MTTLEKLPLERLSEFTLAPGGHRDRTNGLCAMELVAWIAGEPHSDSPVCTSPVLATFVRSWNDAIPDDEARTRLLKPILPRLIGTVGSAAVEQRRADLAFDWCVRVSTPVWLELANLTEEADALRALRPLLDRSAVLVAQVPLDRARTRATAAWAAAMAAAKAAARDGAWDAARDGAWDAAMDGAWDAARAAVRDGAWDAAWDAAMDGAWDAAWDAAMDGAWDAARAAVRDGAWDAARAAVRDGAWDAARAAVSKNLTPTVEQLQVSALDLLDRMIAVTDADVAA